MKLLCLLFARLWFRFRAYNTEVLTTPGPVLLIPNHVSWLDWLFLYGVLDDDWRFVTSSTTAETTWVHRMLMVNRRTFPVDTSSPYAAKRMAEFLATGGRLVLFAEGRITLTGSLMKLFDGTGFLIHKTGAKVITCYLRNARRVPFVRHTGWTRWRPRVTAHFSDALSAPALPEGTSNTIARQRRSTWLRDMMVRQQFEAETELGEQNVLNAVVETAATLPRKIIFEDVSFTELTYRRLMVGVDVLAGEWRKRLGSARNIGVLLPNVNGTPVTLLSLWATGYVPAILNFSTGIPTMLQCAQLAGLKQVITSRVFAQKAKLDLAPFLDAGIELTFLEDVRAGISGLTKFSKLVKHTLACGAGLRVQSPESKVQSPEPRTAPVRTSDLGLRTSDTAVILFTSGSEGVPKGVELTHGNLLANMRQLMGVLDVTDHERFFSAMPLFHSFGLMAGLVVPLTNGFYTFLYPSPLHYRVVPAAVYDKACTVMLGTNTFLNGYARRANPYDFNSVKFLVAGAEKIQDATVQTWAKKFGVRILEGYGATECSPAITINSRLEPKSGSVGRFLPGMEWKLEFVEGVSEAGEKGSGGAGESPVSPSRPPAPLHTGRLLVRGPNVMRGYLNPDANAKFQALGGWYDTGDMVKVDDEGFVHILGRLKRFAKISGEMVSLTAVEDALAGAFPQLGLKCEIAVIAVPDEDKGEKLVAITDQPKLTLEDIRGVIRGKGMTNLCVPREVMVVREIPKLGTGKVNHRELQSRLKAEAA
jgi:acyl-[acyl-carrier-protein]-phospholipid O-acyltransferase/long-chain-fatty-acid--[acyl-carrier-protein] ligase